MCYQATKVGPNVTSENDGTNDTSENDRASNEINLADGTVQF